MITKGIKILTVYILFFLISSRSSVSALVLPVKTEHWINNRSGVGPRRVLTSFFVCVYRCVIQYQDYRGAIFTELDVLFSVLVQLSYMLLALDILAVVKIGRLQ